MDETTTTTILETVGTYTINGMNITTTENNVEVKHNDSDTIYFDASENIKVSTTEGGKLFFVDESEDTIQVSTQNSNNVEVTGGSITFDNATKKFSCTAGTKVSFTRDEQVITFTAPEDISASYKVEEDIYYFELDDNATANVSVTSGGQAVFGAEVEMGGVISYRPETKTFGLTGGNSSHGNGSNTSMKITLNDYAINLTTNDTTIVFIPEITGGKLEMNFPNERKHAMLFTLSKDGQTTFEASLAIDGTINFDADNQELSLTKDTVLEIVADGENSLQITALEDAGGAFSFVDSGIRFAPNEGDGALELNFVTTGRKANLNITGAVIFGGNGKISLEDGTVANFDWEDGVNLKMTSHGSEGSIAFGEKGIQITSDDENLDIDLTIATGVQTHLSGIKGTIYYNAGKISFDDNSTITATTTLGGEPILMTLETIDGTGHLEFASNGVIYSTDTGAMKITWKKDDLESTFIVNSGSVQIGHGLFKIAEGTDLATDLKDFVPALYFTTSGASTYTINGQTITTTAENISMTATDDYMSFTTSADAVEYDGMTFAGAGKVSLSSGGVVLGAGVEATGFGKENSFVLAEAGNVTADAKIFELSEIEGTPREIPMIITVKGAQDGFIFSRTLTKESEAYLDDALDEESFAGYSSPYIGKNFTEKFISAGDSSYRIRTDAIGLEEVIGISDGATITGGASLADEPTLSYYNLVTDTEGSFTIGEKTYNVSGDSSVAIRARFEADTAPYASYFDSLSGTVSGDFTGGQFSINGSSGLQIYGDTLIDIAADENGFEISGLDAGASLKVSAAGTYTVNGTTINANAEDYIVGRGDNGAALLNNAGQSFINYDGDTIVTGTDGNDYILNIGDNATLYGGDGADTVENIESGRVLINAGAGDDSIKNSHSYYPTLEGGDGNDKIVVELGHHSYIDGGAGNDTILGEIPATSNDGWAMGGYATINGGDGDDFINPIMSDAASINGGAGNDTIITSGNDATISGGAGADIISLNGASVDNNIIQYESGDDTIYGFNETSKISLATGAEYSTVQSGDDVILTVGENKITIAGGASLSNIDVINYEVAALEVNNTVDNTLIIGTVFDDTISNSGANVTINGAAGKDYINSNGASALIDGGAGNDSIENSGSNVTISGDAGDDSIENLGSNVSISGSYGNDTLENHGANVTIKPDGGNDYILNSGNNALIDYRGGNDTIYGLDENSTLQIGGGSGAYETLEGEKNIFVFTDENIVILKDALLNTDTININDDTIAVESKAVSLASGGDNAEILRDNISVTGGDGNDSIYNSGDNVTIDAGEGSDTITNYGATTINAAADNDFIQNTATSSSILGDTGNDTIVSRGHYNYIDGGAGDDNIFVTWDTANYNKSVALSSDPIEDVLNSMSLEEKIGQMMMVGVYSTVISDQIKSLLNDSLIGGVILYNNSMKSLEQTKKLNDDMQAFSAQKAPLLIAVDEEGGIVARGRSFLEPAPSQESIGQTGDPDNATYWAKYNAGLLKSIDANINFAPVADVGTTDTRSFSDDTDTVTQFVEAAAQGYEEEKFLYTLKHFPGIGKSKVDTHDNVSHVDASKEVLEAEDLPPFKKIIDDHDNSKFAVMIGHVIYDALDSVNSASFSPAVINNLLREELGYSGVVVTDDLEMGAITNSIDLAEMASGVIQAGGDIALDTSSNPKEVREALLNAVNQGTISEERINESVRRILKLKANLDTGSYATVTGGEGSDFIKTDYYTKYSSITGGAGNDTIVNGGDNNTIDGGEDSDTIYNGGNDTTINAGAGNDSIYNGGNDTTINAGAGNDSIRSYGASAIINGGAGDDLIFLGSAQASIQYNAGDGNDTIRGLTSVDKLQIGDGTGTYSTQQSGDDVIVRVGNGSIRLVDFRDNPRPVIIGEASTSGGGGSGGSGGIDFDFDDEETVTITGGGNEDIDLSKEDYNVAYIDADALGKKNVTLGGNNTVVVEDTAAKVNITASKGSDTIISDGEKVFVSLRGGNTEIHAVSGKMTVAGYNPAKGSGFRTDYDDIFTAVDTGEIALKQDKLIIGSATVVFDNNNAVVNLLNADGDLQKVGGAPQDSSLNLGREKANLILYAEENSTLTAGSGNDTIYAFEGSHVDAGAGNNYIEIDERAESAQGVAVVLGKGQNTITNFKNGFDYESDRLFTGVKDIVNFRFDGTDLKVDVNYTPCGVVSGVGDGGSFVNFLLEDNNTVSKVVAVQGGATVTVEDELADFYCGDKSGVDFTNYDGTISINLGLGGQIIGAGEVLFTGINQVTVGSGLNTLIGSSRDETLTGNSNGITEFGFRAGGGNDVIANFNFDEDKINIVKGAVTDVKTIGGNVRLQVGGGSDFLTINDAQGKHFDINGFTAKVDSNIDFDDTANYFVATASNATLTVGDDVEDDAIIWLDNAARTGSVFKGDIKTLDASGATVKTELAGNDLDNTIQAGLGDASLWGGNGGNDLLVGGAGENTFFYALGNGDDSISGANDGDKIILAGVTLEQISGADFTDGAVAVKFNDGGQLTVNDGGKAVDFVVGEQTFRVNENHDGFTNNEA